MVRAINRRSLLAAGATLPVAAGWTVGRARVAEGAVPTALPAPGPAGLPAAEAGEVPVGPYGTEAGAASPDPASVLSRLGLRTLGAGELDGRIAGPRFRFAGLDWMVFDDHRRPDASLLLVAGGNRVLELGRRLESCAPRPGLPWGGLDADRLGLSPRDLLAEHLLAGGGDPAPAAVRDAAPLPATRVQAADAIGRLVWTVFTGTVQGTQPMPLSATGSTRTLHADQVIAGVADLPAAARRRSEGLLGGGLPAVLHRIPAGPERCWEVLNFADTTALPGPPVPGFQRICRIEDGRATEIRYRATDPAFGPWRADPTPEEFFAALLRFVCDWRGALAGTASCRLPDPSWADMAQHAFAVELIAKPGGTWPAYGAVDRDYAGSEYDGFQDTVTASLFANLLWGRFAQAGAVLDNALSRFTTADGLPVMRGPEVGQTGLFLALVARYRRLSGDAALPARHRDRLRAIATVLTTLHDRCLALPDTDPGRGLLHGWSESDSCLFPDPSVWWKPYFNNTAMAARGLRELAAVWEEIDPAGGALAADWRQRSEQMAAVLVHRVRGAVRHDLQPPYVPILPGVHATFREALAAATPAHPSEQQWPHRVYSELLQAGILPPALDALTLDSMRGHGATSMGVVANIGAPEPGPRALLGFISYGYAEALLRQDRIPDYLLFLYAHRHHCHTPGSWTAAEVADLQGGLPLFCVPAQMTIPILLRWVLAYEDADRDVLHLARAVPTAWLFDPAGIAAHGLPTRWGAVGFELRRDAASDRLLVTLFPPPVPVELWLHLRLPAGWRVADVPGGTDLRTGPPHPVLRLPASTRGDTAFALALHRA